MAGMWRLHRYILGSVMVASLVGVALFVFLLITGNAMRDILEMLTKGQITPQIFFQLLGFLVPYAVSYATPIGTLVGILLVMGRLSANHEITAMKASGISLWRISAPILLFALCVAGFNAWINAYHAPAARNSYKGLIRNVVHDDPMRFIVPQTFIDAFDGRVFFAREKEGSEVRDLWIWELDDEKRPIRVVHADRGSVRFEEETDSLIVTVDGALAELRDEDEPNNLRKPQPTVAVKTTSLRFPLSSLLDETKQETKLSNQTMPQKLARRAQILEERATASDPARQAELWQEQVQVQFRVQDSLAKGYSVFALALIGIPLGLKASRRETMVNVVLAFGLAMAYYVSTVVISWAEMSPHWRPDLLVWLPNLVCQLLGLWFLLRANEH
jgi:lipopolysaccharide export system permease protein